MPPFRFSLPIQLRYADLDAQWHVNNARYLTFLEMARVEYLQNLGLFDGRDFLDLGMIVADVHISYRAPLAMTQSVEVRMRVSKLGGKSFTTEYEVVDAESGEVAATAEVVMVHFNFRTNVSECLPDRWRSAISAYEGIPLKHSDTPSNAS